VRISWNRFNRKIHYWGAILCALPVLIVIVTGLILMLKKDVAWIQPPSQKGVGRTPSLTFMQILEGARSVPEAGISEWTDVDRLDVRPGKGIVKVRGKNRWEIQLDAENGEILQVAYRRSDLIESIHDGSFFHEKVKLWVFLPSTVILLVLWLTGIVLFLQRRPKKRVETKSQLC